MGVISVFTVTLLGVEVFVEGPMLFETFVGAVVALFDVGFVTKAEDALDGCLTLRVDPTNLQSEYKEGLIEGFMALLIMVCCYYVIIPTQIVLTWAV